MAQGLLKRDEGELMEVKVTGYENEHFDADAKEAQEKRRSARRRLEEAANTPSVALQRQYEKGLDLTGTVSESERPERGLKVCLIGTYPPRECGIGTFTRDLRNAICQVADDVQAFVIAMTNPPNNYKYPPEVVFEIRQNQLNDYRLAAEYINFSGADIVCVQHEFGIFGGPEGRYILELLKNLNKPVVTTLHTVLSEPLAGFRVSLIRVANASDRLVVLNSRAIPILKDVYGITEEKVSLIHHGVPDVPFVDPNYYKDKFGVEGRLVLLTFGLLSRNKGIEMMLDALPEIVSVHPEVVYIVLGATHPEVKRRDGEEYRLMLKRRVRELGLEDYVIFYDRYVDDDELREFLGACDIYITPYQSREQIVSGTLAYAVGMGKAVVSTPYLYAEELLANGRGKLVPFGDSKALARTINRLIENEAMRHQMRKRAYKFGRQMTWPEVGRAYVELFRQTVGEFQGRTSATLPLVRASLDVPEIKLDHLVRLTDDTGLIQHATYGIPDRRFGYSTDDAGRALVVTLMHHRNFEDPTALRLATTYLSFLQLAQRPDGRFHNFMNYARQFTDEVGSEDTLGRALWGVGMAVALGPTEGMRALAREMFERSLSALDLVHARAISYAICGLHAFLQRYDGAALVRRKLDELANRLASLYEGARADDWRWFGEELTYANAKLPQAMLLAYQATGEERFLQIGLESLDFLLEQTYSGGQFDFIGNQGWYRRGGERATFGQQPIEAGYTAEACATAYEITEKSYYLEMARAAVEWLLGRNRLGVRLYDLVTGACSDGLDPQGASLNQGAESVICCLLGLLAAARLREKKLEIAATAAVSSATPTSLGAAMQSAKAESSD
jgi:glycosyltransferase involved in cell wall biosynthesis